MKRVQFPRLGEVCYETVLDNGLKIQVVPRPGYLKSYAFFATSYGGMNVRFRKDGVWQETPSGVAHFLEHKMFDTKEGNALQKRRLCQRLHGGGHDGLLFRLHRAI